jgi:hypothetical protein
MAGGSRKGAQQAQEGMERAEAHAEAENPGWRTSADTMLALYMKLEGAGATFTAVEAREWCQTQGMPKSPDARAWGAVIRRAAANKRIVSRGFVPSPSSSANNGPRNLWEVLP